MNDKDGEEKLPKDSGRGSTDGSQKGEESHEDKKTPMTSTKKDMEQLQRFFYSYSLMVFDSSKESSKWKRMKGLIAPGK